jgi:hypothetical protein
MVVVVVVVVVATFHIDFVRKYDCFIHKELLLLLLRQDVGLQARELIRVKEG